MAQKVQGRQNIVKSYTVKKTQNIYLTDNRILPERDWEEDNLFNPTPVKFPISD